MVTDALRDEGYEVEAAADGLEALQLVERRRPDVVLLDLMMPNMDGRTFLRAFRRDPSCINRPVIVLSAAHRANDWATALGAQACLTKPFDLDKLLLTIEQVA